MKINELKESILNNSLSDNFLIFKYATDTFLVDQYINEICQRKGCIRNNISSLSECTNKAVNLIYDYASDINVLTYDEDTKFAEVIEDYSDLKNVIVVCKDIDKTIANKVSEYIVEFPKIVDWQVVDFLKLKFPGLTDDLYAWLFHSTNQDLYRCSMELDKLMTFEENKREKVFYDLVNSSESDLYMIDVFNLVNCIINKNTKVVANFLKHRQLTDITPWSLTALLLNKFKKLLFIRFYCGKSFEELGIKPGEAKYIQKDIANIYSEDTIRQKIKFLSTLDNKLKSGKFEASEDEQLEYIICGVLS